MTGIEAFLQVLAASDVPYIFGNPGTTELPLNAALAHEKRLRYILGLHEVPVMAMADGYAMASGRPAVVNLHVSAGLGNAMGMLYNAHCEGTPLLVTAGSQDRRLRFAEPVLDGDLVRIAQPWTKYAAEVQRPQDVATAVRRAIQIALTPPTGPVFLALPLDVQMQEAEPIDTRGAWQPDRRVRPSNDELRRAAQLLLNARRPLILAGSRVTESGASQALADLAETLGVQVFAESNTSHGRPPIATDHPLYQGPLPLWAPQLAETLAGADLLFVVGMNLFRMYIHQEPESPLPAGCSLIHLDNHPYEIGKNYPIDVGLIGDPLTGLRELTQMVRAGQTVEQSSAAAKRVHEAAATRQHQITQIQAEIAAQSDARPMSPSGLMSVVARVLPEQAAVVLECPTTHQNLLERLGAIRDPAALFAHRGWALGWGIGCALGVRLAWPTRPTLALIGDGSATYGIQGLWTAAQYRIPVVFVVANNTQYGILRVCGDVLGLSELRSTAPGMDVPAVDFVKMAEGLGVSASRVTEPVELLELLASNLRKDEPSLVEVMISR